MIRQILLDTETTGLEPTKGHRIIEIAAVELINRRFTGNYWHYYINPDRPIDEGAQKVHGITAEFLKDKLRFADIAQEFLDYIQDSDLIIHNAPFDLSFLNHEYKLLKKDTIKKFQLLENRCTIIDTLAMARQKHRGQKNNLDALCKRYQVDNSKRDWHGALIDAELLGWVYLAMTGGQKSLFDGTSEETNDSWHGKKQTKIKRVVNHLKILRASPEEIALDDAYYD